VAAWEANEQSPEGYCSFRVHWSPGLPKGEAAVNLIIELPDQDVQVLKAKATARGVSAEQYVLEVLEHNLAAAEPHSAPRRFNSLSDLLLSSPFPAPSSTWSDPGTSHARLILDERFTTGQEAPTPA
jgi:hypothetical protein